jgi:hypothetical protein
MGPLPDCLLNKYMTILQMGWEDPQNLERSGVFPLMFYCTHSLILCLYLKRK